MKKQKIKLNMPGWPNFSDEEANLAKAVLLSNKVNYWTGVEARNFEKEFGTYFDASYSIALANGTVALDLILKALDIGKGDDVIVTPRSFVASASVVVNSGARPVFADVDKESQNITVETIQVALTSNTKAIICVHLAGWPCDMDAILELASQHGVVVIEDCAQAHGASYKGKHVGSFGVAGAWSFCQDKIMSTAGEGGMVTTSDENLYRAMWSFKDHGKSWEKVQVKPASTAFRWIHDSIGTNWRLTEIQAAIGRYQLKQLDQWTALRRLNAAALTRCLRHVEGVRLTEPSSQYQHAYYKYYFFVEPEKLSPGWDRERVVAEVHALGIPCFTGTCPEIYREEAFVNLYGVVDRLPVARELGETSIMLNIHPGITPEDCTVVAEVIKDVMSIATR